MGQRYNDNTKRSKPKENQLGILKIYAFCWEIQPRASEPRDSTTGVRFLSMRIHSKSCCISPVKVATTLLSGSKKGAVGA